MTKEEKEKCTYPDCFNCPFDDCINDYPATKEEIETSRMIDHKIKSTPIGREAVQKRYREKHKKEIAAYQKKYRAEHKKEHNEASKRNYWRNREKILAHRREQNAVYRERYREYQREYHKKYYQEHREELKAYQREYRRKRRKEQKMMKSESD